MVDFKNDSFIYLDLETTGMKAENERIIEIGAVKVKKGEIVDKYEKLINPNKKLNHFIERLTGIRHEDLLESPQIEEIIEELTDFLEDSIIVAHNARFDISFLDAEYSRLNESLKNPYICSVRVARNLYPKLKSCGLTSLINKFKIQCTRRHRALDDAEVIYKFFKKSEKIHSSKALSDSLKRNLVARNP